MCPYPSSGWFPGKGGKDGKGAGADGVHALGAQQGEWTADMLKGLGIHIGFLGVKEKAALVFPVCGQNGA